MESANPIFVGGGRGWRVQIQSLWEGVEGEEGGEGENGVGDGGVCEFGWEKGGLELRLVGDKVMDSGESTCS